MIQPFLYQGTLKSLLLSSSHIALALTIKITAIMILWRKKTCLLIHILYSLLIYFITIIKPMPIRFDNMLDATRKIKEINRFFLLLSNVIVITFFILSYTIVDKAHWLLGFFHSSTRYIPRWMNPIGFRRFIKFSSSLVGFLLESDTDPMRSDCWNHRPGYDIQGVPKIRMESFVVYLCYFI
jgi:hypothetical protein